MLCCSILMLTLTFALTLLRMPGRLTGARPPGEASMPPVARRALTVNGQIHGAVR